MNHPVRLARRFFVRTWPLLLALAVLAGTPALISLNRHGRVAVNAAIYLPDMVLQVPLPVQGASQMEVQVENDKYTATLVGTDRDNDLAVIKIEPPRDHKLTVIRLGTSQGLKVGQKVLAIGNPFGLQRTLTTGIISGLERPLNDPASRRTSCPPISTSSTATRRGSVDTMLQYRSISSAVLGASSGRVDRFALALFAATRPHEGGVANLRTSPRPCRMLGAVLSSCRCCWWSS